MSTEDFKEGKDDDLTLTDDEKNWYTILFGTDFDDDYPPEGAKEKPEGKSKGK